MSENVKRQFPTIWQSSTADNNLTLHGFRRFKTTHLLNLRFLEAEIAELDHSVYQAGLSLDIAPATNDRLGLKHSKKDENIPELDEIITSDLVLKLRRLLQEYDEALITFNKIMSMETFSLLDDEKQSSLRDDLTLFEIYKTRLLRTDQGPRSQQDPFQRWIHQWLRDFRYWRLCKRYQGDSERLRVSDARSGWSYQRTTLLAGVISRLVLAAVTAIFLTVPLVLLSRDISRRVQLAVISTCIVVFSCVVTVMLKVSNLEVMLVSAAYAAILAVFVSNGPGGTSSTASWTNT
ncbi:hypothetical protein F5B20DRAFT_568750 [Whalleya microplaca]|nr:hypothetical protein F5B20DRAFT_568750 [Whalleya microplaca]